MKDKVIFTEQDHKYTGNNGTNYISTTTLISRYKEPFDSEYWSLYKGIEKLVVKSKGQEYFNNIKRKIGYENLIPYFLPKITKDGRLENAINEVLNEWKEKKDKALDKGTAFHKAKEEEVNGKVTCEETGLKVILFKDRKDLHELTDGVYTELVIWNEENELAGGADKVVKEGEWIDVDDYKTSKVIEENSFKHYETGYRMMKKPVQNLMDCNLSHYSLQLSIYGWMLEQKGFKVRRLRIYHSITDKYIEVPYLKKEVEAILKDYGRKRKH